MKYELIVLFTTLLVIYIFKNKKEPFVKPRNNKKQLLVDDNGNIETMSINEIYNAMEDLKKEVFARIEKRGNEWGAHHSNGVRNWVAKNYETKGCIRNHGRVHLLGQGNPCRGLVQKGSDQHSRNVEAGHANPSGHCGNSKGWWKIIQR